MSTPVFYPHLGQQNTKTRLLSKDAVRKELGIARYAQSEDSIKSANEPHGFFGAMARRYGSEGAPGKFHEAANAIVKKHGVTPEVARNYLDSAHGRHVGDRMEAEGSDLHESMKERHGGTEKGVKKALLVIHNATKEGAFEKYSQDRGTDVARYAEKEFKPRYKGWSHALEAAGGNEGHAYVIHGTMNNSDFKGHNHQKAFTESAEDQNFHGDKPEIRKAREQIATKLRTHFGVHVNPHPKALSDQGDSEKYAESQLGKSIEAARTCEHGGKCTKQCDCVTCKKFAEMVGLGTAKYDEEEADTEKDCQSCYSKELADLKQRYARRGPGLLGEEEQRHASRSVDPPDEGHEEEPEEDKTPHDLSRRAHWASAELEGKHGSIGGYHSHALAASFAGDHQLAAKHHTLAADAHDAKADSYQHNRDFSPEHVASSSHSRAAYLHRVAALAHKYPDEKEYFPENHQAKYDNELAGKVIGGIAGGPPGAALGSGIGRGLDKAASKLHLELGGERVSYADHLYLNVIPEDHFDAIHAARKLGRKTNQSEQAMKETAEAFKKSARAHYTGKSVHHRDAGDAHTDVAKRHSHEGNAELGEAHVAVAKSHFEGARQLAEQEAEPPEDKRNLELGGERARYSEEDDDDYSGLSGTKQSQDAHLMSKMAHEASHKTSSQTHKDLATDALASSRNGHHKKAAGTHEQAARLLDSEVDSMHQNKSASGMHLRKTAALHRAAARAHSSLS